MSASLDERTDRHDWMLEGHRLTQLLVDLHGFRFQSWALSESLEIQVAVPFRYAQADGTDREVDPREAEQLAPLLGLLGRLVHGVAVGREGELEVRFGDGSVLTCAPHTNRAAWEVQGAGALEGLAYRSPPGGGVPWLDG